MASIFVFDEEASVSFPGEATVVEEEDICDELDEAFTNLKVDHSALIGSHQESGAGSRRRSSVYLRFSVNTPSSVPRHLSIPADYTEEGPGENGETRAHVRTIHDFEPIKVLGQGAYGKVYLVQDRYTKKLFAQKQIRKPAVHMIEDRGDAYEKLIKRTLSEKQILSSITHHPNVVKLFYALQDHDKFYLILEYLPGGELFRHLTHNNSLGNAFKEDHVAFYAAQMALGMKHLHEIGVVYRDLKPENCLLNSEGHLVLTDFGLSKDIGGHENTCSSIIGTPEYMGPEVLKGEKYDYQADWWSLGCVIFDMMAGHPPFTGNSHKSIQSKIIKQKLQLPFYFSADAKDILSKLLNKNPAKRFQVDEKWNAFKKHRFFRKIDWYLLEKQSDSLLTPIKPVITDPKLAENFSPEFTSLKVSSMLPDAELIHVPSSTQAHHDDDQVKFKGFSYTASSSYIDRFC